jgi:small-conductance mechanosensitive channel
VFFWRKGHGAAIEAEEPRNAPRGPGGGRVRKRPRRKRQQQQPMSLSGLIAYGLFVFLLMFVVEKALFRQPWLASVIASAFGAAIVVAFQAFFVNPRRRRAIEQARRKRR